MTPYLAIFSVYSFLAVPNKKKKSTFFLIASFFFLSWFMGLRYFIGCDYHGYGVRFSQTKYATLGEILNRQELGFELLTYYSTIISDNYNTFLLIASSLLCFLYLKFASAHKEVRFIITLFFPILIIQLGMSGIRQAIAVGFVCLAYNAYIDIKKVKCAILIVCGGMFHTSAFLLLPIALSAGQRFKVSRVVMALLVLSIPAAWLLESRVDVYRDRYIDQIYGAQESGGAWIRWFLTFLPVPLFLFNKEKISEKYSKEYNLLILAALLICVAPVLGIISSVALHRLLYYLMPLSILLIVGTLEIFREKSNGKLFWITPYFGYMVSWFLTSRHATICYTPYQNVMFPNTIEPIWFNGF
ncbi:MAG: EpsG family protein [Hyphomicrobiales bacterium]